MKLITRRQHSAAIFEVYSYGRHQRLHRVTSRIDGIPDSTSEVAKGLTRDEAIKLAQNEADIDRIITTRGCSRNTAKIYLESEQPVIRLNNEFMTLSIQAFSKPHPVRAIALTTDEANDLCAQHKLCVIAEDQNGWIYLVDEPDRPAW
jgi:hypothetical protein